MNPTVKVVISTIIALLSTYTATATAMPVEEQTTGINIPAGIAAVVAALNAVSNLYTKKPNQK